MPVRTLLELGNPLLRQPAHPVADVRSPETQALIADLRDTLRAFRRQHGWGRALAAPVIGVPQRLVLIDYGGREFVLANPRFEAWSREFVPAYESCMAFGTIRAYAVGWYGGAVPLRIPLSSARQGSLAALTGRKG